MNHHKPGKEIRKVSGLYIQTCLVCGCTREVFYSGKARTIYAWTGFTAPGGLCWGKKQQEMTP